MTGAGYTHSSVISGGRRWLSLFLLAVFTPLLWPAETWASLTRPTPAARAYPFAVPVPMPGDSMPPAGQPSQSTMPQPLPQTAARTDASPALADRGCVIVLLSRPLPASHTKPAATEYDAERAPATTGSVTVRVGCRCGTRGNNAAPPGTRRTTLTAPAGYLSRTGYAQILEVSQSVATQCFVIGDDILGQSSGGQTAWLLYDGHGSTRALSGRDAQDQPLITARYSYDAYGVMLGGEPSLSRPAATDLLYSGEQFDAGLQQQYLRARYYDQRAGVFAAMDSYAGSNGDPQSLHKYAYCHGDGVNTTDPSGLFSLTETTTVFATVSVLFAATCAVVAPAGQKTRGVITGVVGGLSLAALLVAHQYKRMLKAMVTAMMVTAVSMVLAHWTGKETTADDNRWVFMEALAWSCFEEWYQMSPFPDETDTLAATVSMQVLTTVLQEITSALAQTHGDGSTLQLSMTTAVLTDLVGVFIGLMVECAFSALFMKTLRFLGTVMKRDLAVAWERFQAQPQSSGFLGVWVTSPAFRQAILDYLIKFFGEGLAQAYKQVAPSGEGGDRSAEAF